jgi:tripartite-type tricarboxylate transporter receptor subunit TctC
MKKEWKEMGRVLFCLMSSILVILLLTLVSGTAFAQTAKYPTRPVNLICTYAAGGGSDTWLRITGKFLEKQLRVPIVVANQAGNGGLLQLQNTMTNIPPDGYTISQLEGSTVIARAMGMTGPDMRSSSQVTVLGCGVSELYFFVAREASNYKTLKDFVSACKAKPGEIRVACTALGSTMTGIAYYLEKMGVPLKVAPLGSTANQMVELAAGRIDTAVLDYGSALPYLSKEVELTKRLRLLAFSGTKRFPLAPDVPTFRELGYEIAHGTFQGLTVRPDTPKYIVETLVKAFRDTHHDPEYVAALDKAGRVGMYYQSPEQMVKQIEIYWKIGEDFKQSSKK